MSGPPYSFGRRSIAALATIHDDLALVLTEAIKIVDFTVLEGHRTEDDQDAAVHRGASKVSYPNSKHNSLPSMAVDVAPYPIDWNDLQRFAHLAGIIRGIAHARGIKIRWGGDWDGDGELRDETFRDYPHLELR